MSFLAEVLSSAETVELKEINEKVPSLKVKIEEHNAQIVTYMENVYLNFSERPRQNLSLVNEVKTIEKEINLLMHNIQNIRSKQLSEANCDVQKHISNLNAINFCLNILTRFCQLNEQFISFDNMLKCNEYLSCMKLICELKSVPNEIHGKHHVALVQEVQRQIDIRKHTLLNKLSNVFSDNIEIKYVSENHTVLKIKKDLGDLQNALKALYFKYTVISLLSSFAGSFWTYFITPAVDNNIQLVEEEDNYFNILEITIHSSKKKSLYPEVFAHLKIMLQFLKKYFDLEIAENISTMHLIGDDIRDNLSELIIKHCLEDTIPSTTEELQNYKIVLQDTDQFEKTIRSCSIFTEDTSSLMDYANNIDIHFINKKCKEYVMACDVIMKKDLHDMKEVGVPQNPNNVLDSLGNELPQCCVSNSAIELMHFLGKIMTQAVSASEVCAGRLVYTVKSIIVSYGHLVPEYHSKLLQTIPQQVAIFQNNCFYISYELTNWKERYSSKLSPKLDTAHCHFVEEARQIQQIGMDCFMNYVHKTIDSLRIVGIDGPMLEDLSSETEKSIRQCMRQQELLKTVWHKVLSYQLYNQNIGSILDVMCSNIINAVVRIEDISSKAAEQLVDVFKIVITRGPKLFTDPKEINLFVHNWSKFTELNFVLGASLININDRWADGKGPLALQFTASEMRSLIRALFQNTDRRAAVVSRIQD